MRFSWIFVTNALICQVCIFEIFPQVAAEDDVVYALQVYAMGETAQMFSPRSEREGLKEFKEYRGTWKNDTVAFAILKKGTQIANCPQGVLQQVQQFCQEKVNFKIWNATHLLLEIKDTTFSDSGNYSVEHVFGGMEGNHKDIIPLKIVAKSTGLSTPSQGSSTGNSELPTTRPSSRASTVAGKVSFALLKMPFAPLFVLHFIL